MAIQYVGGQLQSITASTATNTTINFSLTGGLASTPAADDIVIVTYGTSSIANRTIGVNTAGYAEIAELYQSDTYDINLSVSWKRMGSTPDTSVEVSATGATADGGYVLIQVYRGVDTTTALDVTSTTAQGNNGGTPNPAAITPTTSGAVIVAIGGTAYASVTVSYAASYLTNFITGQNNAATYDVIVGMGWVNWTSGTYDPAAFTFTGTNINQSWGAVTLALRPQPDTATADLAATEGADTAAFTLSTVNGLDLAATDIADSAGFSADVYTAVSLAATDAPDTASFSATAVSFSDVTLSATEAQDTASFSGIVATPSPAFEGEAFWEGAFYATATVRTANLAATEAIDTASFALAARTNVALAATEAIDTASFALSARTNVALAATEAPDTAAFTVAIGQTMVLAATEALDTASMALAARTNVALAATEAQDTASFALSARHTATLAATEAPDTASMALAARTNVTLAGNEAQDTASVDVQVFSGLLAELHASEAADTADFSMKRTFLLVAANGGYSYTGYDALLLVSRVLDAGFGHYVYTGHDVALAYPRFITAEAGSYTVTGYAARLYESSFFYNDSEVIYVPQETNSVLVAPAAQDADENIVVPAEVQLLTLDFEDREIKVPADDPVEELPEYRESVAEARLRTA